MSFRTESSITAVLQGAGTEERVGCFEEFEITSKLPC